MYSMSDAAAVALAMERSAAATTPVLKWKDVRLFCLKQVELGVRLSGDDGSSISLEAVGAWLEGKLTESGLAYSFGHKALGQVSRWLEDKGGVLAQDGKQKQYFRRLLLSDASPPTDCPPGAAPPASDISRGEGDGAATAGGEGMCAAEDAAVCIGTGTKRSIAVDEVCPRSNKRSTSIQGKTKRDSSSGAAAGTSRVVSRPCLSHRPV
jgi:hypothetical protein